MVENMKKKEFKINSKNTLDWMVNYFDELNKYPVKSKVKPRDIFNKIPKIQDITIAGFII